MQAKDRGASRPLKWLSSRQLIAQSGLRELSNPIGQQSPDGYAYELIARFGRKSAAIEFFDGSIPVQLHALLQQLKMLMTPAPE